jgi:hypothetical protein
MILPLRHRVSAVAVLLPLVVSGLTSQHEGIELTVDAPVPLARAADRVRNLRWEDLTLALARAGLQVPPRVHVTLVHEDDERARRTPAWVVGLASGSQSVVIFPERVGSYRVSYPYDSLESIVWHEVVHLALSGQAGGQRLPRWFHEGVAMSVERAWGVGSEARLLFAAVSSPGLADLGPLFAFGSQPETASAYLLAAALVSDIQERHGAATPGAIVDHVARGVPFAHAFALETGETPSEAAARAWHGYRRLMNWIPALTSASSVWFGIMALASMAFLATLRKRWRRRREWVGEDVDAPVEDERADGLRQGEPRLEPGIRSTPSPPGA